MLFDAQFILALTMQASLTDTYMIIPYLTNPKPVLNFYLPIFS